MASNLDDWLTMEQATEALGLRFGSRPQIVAATRREVPGEIKLIWSDHLIHRAAVERYADRHKGRLFGLAPEDRALPLALTEEDRARLDAIAAEPGRMALRARVVLAAAKPGAVASKAIREIRINRMSFYAWIAKFRTGGVDELVRDGKKGRPRSVPSGV